MHCVPERSAELPVAGLRAYDAEHLHIRRHFDATYHWLPWTPLSSFLRSFRVRVGGGSVPSMVPGIGPSVCHMLLLLMVSKPLPRDVREKDIYRSLLSVIAKRTGDMTRRRHRTYSLVRPSVLDIVSGT